MTVSPLISLFLFPFISRLFLFLSHEARPTPEGWVDTHLDPTLTKMS